MLLVTGYQLFVYLELHVEQEKRSKGNGWVQVQAS
jgi:hypothetical protein